MIPDDLSSISDEELEKRIADSRPNSYVPSSVYHVYVAEQEKRKHQRLLDAIEGKKRASANKKAESSYRKRMSNHDMKILWGKARNRCSICKKKLIHQGNEQSQDVVVGVESHIVGHSQNGPRGNDPMPLSERHKYPNRILLCMECSKIIDEQPEKYTADVLHKIKKAHEEKMEKEEQVGESIQSKFNTEIFKEICIDKHLSSPNILSTHILVVPQSNLKLYDTESYQDLYHEWHDYGLYDAIHPPTIFTSNPLPGVTYGFERKGTLFYAKTVHEENAVYCSKLSIFQDGKMLIGIKYAEDYYEDTFLKELSAFLDFVVKFYQKKGLLPNVKLGIWVGFDDLRGKEIKLLNHRDLWHLLHKRIFHEDDFWEKIDEINFEKLSEKGIAKNINDNLISRLNKYSREERRQK